MSDPPDGYVLVVMEHASRRIIQLNVTSHPTAAWTLQQLRETIPADHTYRFMLHDHDAIFSAGCAASIAHLGLKVVKTPVRSPQAKTPRQTFVDAISPAQEKILSPAVAAGAADGIVA